MSGVIWLRLLRWVLLVLHWDGVLPLLVWSLPGVLRELFPGRRGVVEFSAVVFPIVVFGWRYRVGLRVIAGNACGGAATAAAGVFCGDFCAGAGGCGGDAELSDTGSGSGWSVA